MRFFVERGGPLLGAIPLAGFEPAGGRSSFSRIAGTVLDDITAASWGEVVDEAGAVVAMGPVHDPFEVHVLREMFRQQLANE